MPMWSKDNTTLSTWSFHVTQPAMNARKKVGQVAFPLNDLHCQPLIHPSPGKYLPVDEPRLAPSEVDSILPSVQVKKMFVEKKVTSSDNQAVRQACLKLNIDESSWILEFLALKADKRNLERNTIQEDICWEIRDDIERLTNKELRLYLRQEGLMVSGNKAQLVERILKHADVSGARTFDEDIEDDDENMPSSSHDDTSSDSEEESTEYEGGSSGDDSVERSFQVFLLMMQTYQK